jgi:NADH-quinone oxidoreductase subunit N
MSAPVLNYSLLAPILIILGGALLGVLVEAFISKALRSTLQLGIALGSVVLSFVWLWKVHNDSSISAAVKSVAMDPAGIYIQGIILILAFIAILLIADQDNFTAQASALPGSQEESAAIAEGKQQTEVFPLTLFAIAGMMLFPIATDLITLFVALEVLSLPLYLMAGLSRRRRLLSQEAALKYFLLGAFSSAIFLFGIAFLYGYAGSLNFNEIANSISASGNNSIFLYVGIIFISVGLLFKVGAVPFHSWTPDVYQGAPTPITGFMAACTKVAAFGATLRLFYVALDSVNGTWKPIITAIAMLTMLIGAIAAMTQRDIKRSLAYSSVAHAGFLLIGVVALNQAGLAASLFYFLAYGLATLGAFAIITIVRDSSGEVTDLNRWVGLGKKSPLIAAIFSIFLLSFGGIPLTAGFIGKFAIFSAAYQGGNMAIVVVAVLASAMALFFYLRIVLMMWFAEPTNGSVTVVIPSILTRIAIFVTVGATVIFGIVPAPLLDSAKNFAVFLR